MKRLTPATLSMIMFMVVGGLVAAYVAKGLFAVEKPKPQLAEITIPAPLNDLAPGTVLTEQHIGLLPIRVSELRPDMLRSNRVIVGRIVKEKLKAAQPIRAAQLYEPGGGPPLDIEDGMRAVTLDFAATSAIVEGFIKPGQYCDVHLSVNDMNDDDRYAGGGLTLTLFKGVRILAINKLMQQGQVERTGNTVTLELTPAQANIAILARQKGLITLSYNPNGKGSGGIAVANEDRVMLYEILGLQPRKKPPEPFTSQIYRGLRRQSVQFLNNNQVSDMGNNYGPTSGGAQPNQPGPPPAANPLPTANDYPPDPAPAAPSGPPSASLPRAPAPAHTQAASF